MGSFRRVTVYRVTEDELAVVTDDASVVMFECGYCQERYALLIEAGDKTTCECPKCRNKSLQLVCG